jgi:hypothetical protein
MITKQHYVSVYCDLVDMSSDGTIRCNKEGIEYGVSFAECIKKLIASGWLVWERTIDSVSGTLPKNIVVCPSHVEELFSKKLKV